MQEDKFDDKIRELLNEAHDEYNGTSWDELSKKLDDLDGHTVSEPDAYIPIVKEKLQDQRSEVNEEHWASMKSELDYIQDRRARLYVIKALEAAIVLLLVMTYFNYKWLSEDLSIDSEYLTEVVNNYDDPQMISAELLVLNDDSKPQIEYLSTQIVPPLPQINIHQAFGFKYPISGATDRTDLHQSLSYNWRSAAILNSNIDHLNIERLTIQSLKTPNPHIKLPQTSILEQSDKNNSKPSSWTVGIPFSFDVDFVNTDINLGYLSDQIKSGLGGQSIGLSVGFRKHNIELETGFRYSAKTFVPGLLTNYAKSGLNSYIESQLDHMVIHQFQIPLLAKVYTAPNAKSSFYGVFGFAANAITRNSYDISRTVQSKARLESTPLTRVIDLRELPKGISDGGSFSENIYVTGVIGFGLQAQFANGASWYIQPQYQHSFTSDINRLITKINSLNVETGFRFSF